MLILDFATSACPCPSILCQVLGPLRCPWSTFLWLGSRQKSVGPDWTLSRDGEGVLPSGLGPKAPAVTLSPSAMDSVSFL